LEFVHFKRFVLNLQFLNNMCCWTSQTLPAPSVLGLNEYLFICLLVLFTFFLLGCSWVCSSHFLSLSFRTSVWISRRVPYQNHIKLFAFLLILFSGLCITSVDSDHKCQFCLLCCKGKVKLSFPNLKMFFRRECGCGKWGNDKNVTLK
jgi:hypothetical protein